ncbi:hypothetical protein GQ53DRAFT_710417 [Thozetella sp. PMI_491]|nr:hypothetical protein GQ53DRAFT_710417 [Thozetella sp. PMI_491]
MQQSFSTAQPDQRQIWTAGAGARVGPDGAGFGDAGARNVNQYGAMMSPLQNANNQFSQAVPSSMALARRGINQALVPSGARSFDPSSDSWAGFPDGTGPFLPGSEPTEENDSIEALEERAKRVMREAGANKKSIPPFVQKLASFLESSQNTELIRWNDAGDGFIVLDEDEFARKLIPELFKHNNYASFVRQLNMYGFHKRVGLSDNSMKASERKNKAPSEYYNPYFRRGHPNLLWLINKPKSGGKKKSKKDENEPGSDDDGAEEIFASGAVNNPNSAGEVAPLQKKDIIQVKSQLEKLQQQQSTISAMLGQMRKEHTQLFQQALAFQDQHNRHENSINAILNFLANVFRKSLEEQGGAQSVQELLASIIPTAQGHGPTQLPQHGSVVDLGDLFNRQTHAATTVSPPKRPQRLLLPPTMQGGKATTVSPSSTAPATPQVPFQGQPMGSVTELLDASPSDTSSPAYIKSELQSNPQQGMMKIIQDTNASINPAAHLDLPNVAANTAATLTSDQRAKMLDIMSGSAAASNPAIPATSPPPPSGLGQNTNTSLGADGEDFNFSLDGGQEYAGSGGLGIGFEPGKVLEATDTPSPTGTEEFRDAGQPSQNSPERGVKRRRRG